MPRLALTFTDSAPPTPTPLLLPPSLLLRPHPPPSLPSAPTPALARARLPPLRAALRSATTTCRPPTPTSRRSATTCRPTWPSSRGSCWPRCQRPSCTAWWVGRCVCGGGEGCGEGGERLGYAIGQWQGGHVAHPSLSPAPLDEVEPPALSTLPSSPPLSSPLPTPSRLCPPRTGC